MGVNTEEDFRSINVIGHGVDAFNIRCICLTLIIVIHKDRVVWWHFGWRTLRHCANGTLTWEKLWHRHKGLNRNWPVSDRWKCSSSTKKLHLPTHVIQCRPRTERNLTKCFVYLLYNYSVTPSQLKASLSRLMMGHKGHKWIYWSNDSMTYIEQSH